MQRKLWQQEEGVGKEKWRTQNSDTESPTSRKMLFFLTARKLPPSSQESESAPRQKSPLPFQDEHSRGSSAGPLGSSDIFLLGLLRLLQECPFPLNGGIVDPGYALEKTLERVFPAGASQHPGPVSGLKDRVLAASSPRASPAPLFELLPSP